MICSEIGQLTYIKSTPTHNTNEIKIKIKRRIQVTEFTTMISHSTRNTTALEIIKLIFLRIFLYLSRSVFFFFCSIFDPSKLIRFHNFTEFTSIHHVFCLRHTRKFNWFITRIPNFASKSAECFTWFPIINSEYLMSTNKFKIPCFCWPIPLVGLDSFFLSSSGPSSELKLIFLDAYFHPHTTLCQYLGITFFTSLTLKLTGTKVFSPSHRNCPVWSFAFGNFEAILCGFLFTLVNKFTVWWFFFLNKFLVL